MTVKPKFKELLETATLELKDLTTVQNPDFRLEQAEYNEMKKEWEIVVSFLVKDNNKRLNPIGLSLSEFEFQRIYKKLKINSSNEIMGLFLFND
ncbi:MAG: hypothetical protein FGM41_10075 [Bacteroidetes bacterium]|nr:hypothetical protein [Bacteroidota bacterium]